MWKETTRKELGVLWERFSKKKTVSSPCKVLVLTKFNDYPSNQLDSYYCTWYFSIKYWICCSWKYFSCPPQSPAPLPPTPNTHTLHRNFFLLDFAPNPSIMSSDLPQHGNGYYLELHNKKKSILTVQKTWYEGFANLPHFSHVTFHAHFFICMQSQKTSNKQNLLFLTTFFPSWTDTAGKRRCQRTWTAEWWSVAWWHMHHTELAFYSALQHCATAIF